jgi:Trk K+ transport system NAD-binding subunit
MFNYYIETFLRRDLKRLLEGRCTSFSASEDNPSILKEFPLEIFGIDAAKLFGMVANAPAKVNAFISTLAEIAQDPRFPAGTLIIGYQAHPHEDLTIPNGSTVLESGSTILAVTKPGLVRQMLDFMGLCA